MENTEAQVVHRPELTIKEILVTATVGVRGAGCCGGDHPVDRTASFAVNTETWECKGEIAQDIVMIDEEWWAGQCKRVSDRVQKVSDRVRAGIKTLSV
jgi:hypothetical protein